MSHNIKAFLKDLNAAQAKHGLRLATLGTELVVLPVFEQPTTENSVVICATDDATVVEEFDATLVLAKR